MTATNANLTKTRDTLSFTKNLLILLRLEYFCFYKKERQLLAED